jgi:hypothetical protein
VLRRKILGYHLRVENQGESVWDYIKFYTAVVKETTERVIHAIQVLK